MTIDHVCIYQVCEQNAFKFFFGIQNGFFNTVIVVCGMVCACHAAVFEDVFDFTDGCYVHAFFFRQIQNGHASRFQREVFTVFGASVVAAGTDEGTGNDTSNTVFACQQFSGCFTDFVEFVYGNDVFMGSNLEYAVSGSINNRITSFYVFIPQILNDNSAGSGIVAQCFGADGCFKFVHNFFGETCFCESGEGFFCQNAGDFPVTCGGVFPDGFFAQFAVCTFGCVHFAKQVDVFPLNVTQTQCCHVRQRSFRSCFFDIY